MKAMILAAGYGSRMMPLTKNLPKPLLRVRGVSMIERRVRALQQAGFNDVVINVHYLGDKIIAALGNGQKFGINIRYVEEQQLLETAGGIKNALPLLGEEPFLVVPSDTVMDLEFNTLPVLAHSFDAHLVMVANPSHHPEGDYGIDSDGLLSHKGDKFTYSSVAIFAPSFFNDMPDGKVPLRDLFNKGIEMGCIKASLYEGFWADIGSPAKLKEINSVALPFN